MDTYNYIKENNPISSKILKDFMKRHNLINIWRKNNPDKKKFTWFRPSPQKAGRLDYFIISPSILDIYADAYISYKYRSDHCKIGIKLHLDKSVKGKGTWKLNSDLLKNSDLTKQIDGILLMIEIHACTPYNPEFVKTFATNEISFMVSIDIFWEVLLAHLRGIFISNAAKMKRERSNRECILTIEIENLDELYTLDNSDINLEKLLKKNSGT